MTSYHLNDAKRQEIIERLHLNEPVRAIARKVGVTPSTVRYHRDRAKDVTVMADPLRMTPAQLQRERAFYRDDGQCFAKTYDESHVCQGRLQLAHVLPKAGLRNWIKGMAQTPRMKGHPLYGADIDKVIYDERCGLTLCELAHVRFDRLGIRPDIDQLPEFVHEWAGEWWLEGRLRDHFTVGNFEAAA